MADEAERNRIDGEGRDRSTTKGDVPERLRRRYYLDEAGGSGLGFYADARIAKPAFRDRGAQLLAARADPNAVRDMALIAKHRGWGTVVVRGEVDFRREAWLEATALGIEVRGYRPTVRDRQELERRVAALARREEQARGRGGGRREAGQASAADMKVIEAVVRARVGDRSGQERILAAARERIARWLERGARFEPVRVGRSRERAPGPGRERGR